MSEWIIDREYNDRGEYGPGDEFTSWFRIDFETGWGIANSGGIRVLAAGKNGEKCSDHYSCMILITDFTKSVWDNPWTDHYSETQGILNYWGDAKFHMNKRVDDWQGNKKLTSVNENILLRKVEVLPPILYFQRIKQGKLRFCGLFKLDNMYKEAFYDYENEQNIINYKCILSRIDETRIDPEWIKDRAKTGKDKPGLAPSKWISYLSTFF
jgi:hypothetical protein|tara:strand:- start:7426 stop:8058 length:633 start_codon:yes stop_codon:yes gene_type:complete